MKKKQLLIILSCAVIFSACVGKMDAVPVEQGILTHSGDKHKLKTCAKEIKTVYYKDNYMAANNFPVTVRKYCTCQYGGGM